MTHGERVRKIRTDLGLTAEKFGKQLGVGKTAISNIENGKRNLTEQMIKAICREYNASYDWLMYENGDPFDDLPQTILDELCKQYDLDEYDRFIVEFYVTLPSELRALAKEKAKELLHERILGKDK